MANIQNKITENIELLKSKKIVIWGTGSAARLTFYILKSFDLEPKYFIDGLGEYEGKKFCDKDVFLRAQLEKEDKTDLIILIASSFASKIIPQISNYNYLNLFELTQSCAKGKSCRFVEGNVLIFPDRISHCSIAFDGNFEMTVASKYKGGKIPDDNIRKSREEYRRIISNINEHEDARCSKCHFAGSSDIIESKYLLNSIIFCTLFECNLECNYCSQYERGVDMSDKALDILEICEDVVKRKLLDPKGSIMWSGGEPALIKNLDKAMKLMIDYGVHNEVVTDSTIFSKTIYENLKKYVNVGLTTSIDCGTSETFLRKKKHDLYDKAWENIKKYLSTGANVSVKYIISDDNISRQDLDGFVRKAVEVGIKNVLIDIDQRYTHDQIHSCHFEAGAFLYKKLKENCINTVIGCHSIGTYPDFEKTVKSLV